MSQLQDYYKILQVHPQAERDVIEAAYKRLAKKYHPDVAGHSNEPINSDLSMQRLNEAYEVLKDEATRAQYHISWQKAFARVHHDGSVPTQVPAYIQQAQLQGIGILNQYFDAIIKEQYEGAYGLLTPSDHQKISLNQYILWQTAVRRIFALQNFSIQAGTTEHLQGLKRIEVGMSLRFVVMTIDYNAIMERLEQDVFERKVVRAGRGWFVCLEMSDIQAAIDRYDALYHLVETRDTMKMYVNSYSKHDRIAGVYNKKGILELVEREGLRQSRYGRRFSLMLIGIAAKGRRTPLPLSDLVTIMGETLVASMRELDSIGRWSDSSFAIMMPETDLRGAILAAQKLKRQLSRLFKSSKFYPAIELPCAVDVYPGTLALAVDRLEYLYEASINHPRRALISMRGAIEMPH